MKDLSVGGVDLDKSGRSLCAILLGSEFMC